jgi:integrase
MASIEKRVRNGKRTYRVRYRDPAGRQRSRVFARSVDAERWLHENETARIRGAWVDPAAGKVRLGEWAERWYATTAALRPTTRRDYRKLLDQQVLPAFERAPLAAIDTLAVREWLAGLVAGGLGSKRAGKARAVLSQVLDAAVEGGKLSRNVAAGVKPPKVQRAEMGFLDAGQVEALAEAIDPRWATMIRFGAYSGLRPSELTALRVGRLDLLRGTVRVVEAATEVDGHLHWGPVKTHEARTVRLPRSICEELGEQLAGRPHGSEDLAFPAPLGGPMRWGKWTRRYFKPAAVDAGLFVTRTVEPTTGEIVVSSALRVYDLRHTCASLLIREGASVKAVQAQLGHATASMTLDRYGHLFPDELDQLAGRLEAARAAALEARAARVWPQGGPTVIPLSEGAGR